MKILIAGSSGLIGTALCGALTSADSEVVKLERSKTATDPMSIFWDPENEELAPHKIEGFDVIINLSGENVFGKWTPEKKRKILESRVQTTSLLAKTIAVLHSPPQLFLNASAVGYYGNRGDEVLTEQSSPGKDFLADVCRQWEQASLLTNPTLQKNVRCAIIRTGIVLSPLGGTLKTMLLPFYLGLGGKIGFGNQYMSWIAIEDVIGAIFFIIQHKTCCGAFNLVSPEPVTNQQFTKTLGKVLNRSTILPFPTFAARLFLGEMVDSLLLSSIRAKPQKLMENDYTFLYPELEGALRHLLAKNSK